MVGRALVIALLLAGTAHAERITAPDCKTPRAQRVRTDIDWCNFDFGFTKGPLVNGRSSLHLYRKLGEPHDTITTRLTGVVYSHKLAAIVLETTITSGARGDSSTSTTIHIYRRDTKKPALLGSIGPTSPPKAISFEAKGIIAVTSGDGTVERYRRDRDDYVEVSQRP